MQVGGVEEKFGPGDGIHAPIWHHLIDLDCEHSVDRQIMVTTLVMVAGKDDHAREAVIIMQIGACRIKEILVVS